MNIFATDPDPVKSAKALDDKRVNKMILESAQMLCTALHLNNASHLAKYRKTHANHPSNIWTRETRSNYEWLLAHYHALLEEYYDRSGGKRHASGLLYNDLKSGAVFIPAGPLTPIANCAARQDMNINFKHLTDTYLAYKLYLLTRWTHDKREPTWHGVKLLNSRNHNSAPEWIRSFLRLYVTLHLLA